MKILMVCLGNICRSPLAEGVMKHKADQLGLGWVVDSAGTGAWHAGEQPDKRSIAEARRHGIDITDQRARQFRQRDFDDFDLILVMDRQNHRNVLQLARKDEHRQKVTLMLELANFEAPIEVPDPYYDNNFGEVFSLIDRACDVIIERLTVPEEK